MTPTARDRPGLLGRRHRPGRQSAERPRLDRRDPGQGRYAADPDVARPVRRVRRARRPRHPVGRRGGSGAERRGRGGVPRPRRPRRDLRGRSVASPESQAVETAGGERVLDVRSLVGTLRPAEAALLGYARGILYWHRHQRYCGTCGSPTRGGHGGHLRTCQNEACARLHFPRVEPAVIMLVENQGTRACWPGTRVRPPGRTRPWRASSGSARAWRTRCGARSPKRPACPSGR